MLSAFRDGIWLTERRARFYGVETGTRMTLVRLADGGLFVHSPVALDPETRSAVDALGPVRAVVAPSIFHHLSFGQWIDAYPDAAFFACPGLDAKRPDLAFHGVLADVAHPLWAAELGQLYFSARRENEVVFFHHATRTLISADALINLSGHDYRSTRIVARLMGNTAPGVGHFERIMIRDRTLARRQVDRILGWPIDGVVLAHGTLVDREGREVVKTAYSWL